MSLLVSLATAGSWPGGEPGADPPEGADVAGEAGVASAPDEAEETDVASAPDEAGAPDVADAPDMPDDAGVAGAPDVADVSEEPL